MIFHSIQFCTNDVPCLLDYMPCWTLLKGGKKSRRETECRKVKFDKQTEHRFAPNYSILAQLETSLSLCRVWNRRWSEAKKSIDNMFNRRNIFLYTLQLSFSSLEVIRLDQTEFNWCRQDVVTVETFQELSKHVQISRKWKVAFGVNTEKFKMKK